MLDDWSHLLPLFFFFLIQNILTGNKYCRNHSARQAYKCFRMRFYMCNECNRYSDLDIFKSILHHIFLDGQKTSKKIFENTISFMITHVFFFGGDFRFFLNPLHNKLFFVKRSSWVFYKLTLFFKLVEISLQDAPKNGDYSILLRAKDLRRYTSPKLTDFITQFHYQATLDNFFKRNPNRLAKSY